MRRSFLKLMASCAYGTSFGTAIFLSGTAMANSTVETFAVLNRPALAVPASGAAMLAVAKAGHRLVAVGERGIVLLSDDEAKSWRQAQVPVSVTLTAVQFIDDRVGWAVGHLGVILHTNDGGLNWTRQLDGVQAAAIVLKAAQASDAGGRERRVTDAQALVRDGPDKPFLDLYFESASTGYVVGAYNLAFRTNDGGRSWHSWMEHMDNPNRLHLYAIKPVGDSLYVAGEQGLLLRSSDRGQHFSSINSPSKGTYFGIVSGGKDDLLIYGLRGRAYWSGDGAASWTSVETGSQSSLSAGIRLANGATMLATQAGELFISNGVARNFRAVGSGTTLPVTGLLEATDGNLIISSMRGLRKLESRSLHPRMP